LGKIDTSSAKFPFYPQAHPVEGGDKEAGDGRRASPMKPNLPQQDGLDETTTKNQSSTNVFVPARRGIVGEGGDGLAAGSKSCNRQPVSRKKAEALGSMLPLPLQFLAAWLGVWFARALQQQVGYLTTP
jgi:hypothetical protein